jgi:two-component system, OmpR family, osmolarity sensor histidine kinase EnvZ
MCLSRMDRRAMALPHRLERLLGYGALGLGLTALSLALLQGLLSRELMRSRLQQQASEAAFTARLVALALESLPPAGLAQLTGLSLRVQSPPPVPPLPEQPALQQLLCRQLAHCPTLRSAHSPRGVWLELHAPLEPVWLLVPLPGPSPWPPDPWLLAGAVAVAGLTTTLVYLTLEVELPLRRLQARVDDPGSLSVAQRGTHAVQVLGQRLQHAAAERSVMLAGLAHDLRAPLTRLRLRLNTAAASTEAAADLDALERLVDQFLVFAAGEQGEAELPVPLEQLLAELAAAYPPELQLQLMPLTRRVRPLGLSRAAANLLDNAYSYGQGPVLLRLLPWGSLGQGFAIEVWDGGDGIDPAAWPRALEPFQRLDQARTRRGHSGLGLPIAQRVAQVHGGELALLRDPLPALRTLGVRSGVALYCPAERSGHTSAGRQLQFSQT